MHQDAPRRPKDTLTLETLQRRPKDAQVFIETHRDAQSDAQVFIETHRDAQSDAPSIHRDVQRRPKTPK